MPGSGWSAGEGIGYPFQYSWASLVAQLVTNCKCGRPGFNPWVGKTPWRREWLPTPVFLSGKSHGQGAWWATVHGVSRVRHNLVTKLPNDLNSRYSDIFPKRRCASLLVFQYLEVYFYLSHHHLHFYELDSYLLLPFFVSIVLTFESKTHTHTSVLNSCSWYQKLFLFNCIEFPLI